MKKFLSVILAAAMVFTMSVAVSAAPSPSTDPNVVEVTSADGSRVSAEKLAQFTTSSPSETAPSVDGFTPVKTFDVTVPSDASSVNGYYVNYNVPGVKKGDIVKVWQYVNGNWEEVEAVAIADNVVRILVKANGTIAVYKVASGSGNGGGNTNNGTSGNGSNGSSNGVSSGTTTTTGGSNVSGTTTSGSVASGAAAGTTSKGSGSVSGSSSGATTAAGGSASSGSAGSGSTYKVTSTTSPKTGDNTVELMFAVCAAMFAATAVFAAKKARA